MDPDLLKHVKDADLKDGEKTALKETLEARRTKLKAALKEVEDGLRKLGVQIQIK
jgi:hypothetical protein